MAVAMIKSQRLVIGRLSIEANRSNVAQLNSSSGGGETCLFSFISFYNRRFFKRLKRAVRSNRSLNSKQSLWALLVVEQKRFLDRVRKSSTTFLPKRELASTREPFLYLYLGSKLGATIWDLSSFKSINGLAQLWGDEAAAAALEPFKWMSGVASGIYQFEAAAELGPASYVNLHSLANSPGLQVADKLFYSMLVSTSSMKL